MQANYKTLDCLVLLLFLISCGSSKDIVVRLSPKYDLSREMGQTFWTTKDITNESPLSAYAQQLGLDNFIITHFLHRPWEHYYFEWKEGKKDSASYFALLSDYNQVVNIPANFPKVDGESLFLFGREKKGQYIVVADENNNNSFLDDSVRMVIPITGKKTEDVIVMLPTVRIKNLQGVNEGNVFTFSVTIELRPTVNVDTTDTGMSHLYLNVVSSEYFTGQFRYHFKRHKLAARNTVYPLLSNKQHHIAIKFANGREDSAFLKHWNYRPEYRSGDTLVLGRQMFFIKKISPLVSEVTLQPLKIAGRNLKPKSPKTDTEAIAAQSQKWIGKPFPSFTLQQETDVLSSEKLIGKVLFINFWFAACPPCIAEFEALSQMYDKLKDKAGFQFISFTFESPEVIEKVKKKYGLRFPIYSISQQECERLNPGGGYPTNIIVGKNGVIKQVQTGGETDEKAAKNFFDNVFNVKILEEL